MDLPRLISLNKYWESYPPIHILIAGYVGYKKPEKATKTNLKEDSLDDFFAMVPQIPFAPPKVKNAKSD